MQNRPLRPFEQGAHLHVIDWCHDTARYRLQAAGAVQVKAAAQVFAAAPPDQNNGPPDLPSLEAAITAELRKLYALGYATVRSELQAQAQGSALTIGLSVAPAPPNLRKAKAKRGKAPACGTCRMFDAGSSTCWGYGNWPVKPNQLCDAYAPESSPKQLALSGGAQDPGLLRVRARLAAAAVAHAVWQAIHRAKLQGISEPKRLGQIGRDAGSAQLGVQASHHAGGAISAGRAAGALSLIQGGGPGAQPAARIAGARYTSVLDKNTCGPCAAADDGVLRALEDPGLVQTPNPACRGGDRCRCILVYEMVTESGSAAEPIAAGG
ncbi:MAG: hypothetical protein NVSMB18_36470 [Acetobacteraceae bacterium]